MKIYRWEGRCNICGENVQAIRKAQGLSQEQLAARMQLLGIQMQQKAISRIETGERLVADYELVALGKVLGVPLEELLRRAGDGE